MTRDREFLTVLSGDLVHSRQIDDRAAVADDIHRAIEQTNERFDDEMLAPLVLTRGMDELSGVLERSFFSYRICRYLNDLVAPQRFRFAIARNTLDVGLDTRDARRMDGTAFHRTAELLARYESRGILYAFDLMGEEALSRALTELASLVQAIRSDWTDRQRDIAAAYEQIQNQKDVAKDMGVTQQAVSDTFIAAHYKDVKNAEWTIQWTLGKLDETSDAG